MADRLADAGDERSNLTQATFLEYVGRHEDVDREILDAKETVRSLNKRRRDLRKTIKAVGINIEAFDRQLRDVSRSGEEREAEDEQYRRYMRWRMKPVGYQPSLDFAGDADEEAVNVHELHSIDNDGLDAGRGGRRADSNPWTPGTEPHQRWHTAWMRGQELLIAEMPAGGSPNGGGHQAPPRRRGRPPGSRDAQPRQRRPHAETPGTE